jgi:hypothetical protein
MSTKWFFIGFMFVLCCAGFLRDWPLPWIFLVTISILCLADDRKKPEGPVPAGRKRTQA